MLTITHTHAQGTLIEGTTRADGTAAILKANRWRWSRHLGAWYVPRSRDQRAPRRIIDTTVEQLRAAGHEVTVTIDDTRRDTATVEADKIARQDERVAALQAKAERLAGREQAAWARHEAAVDRLPEGGEPVKIGHHSEARHRRDLNRAWNTIGTAVKAGEEARAAESAAEAAAHTTASRYSPVTVGNRIASLEASQRKTRRRLDGYTTGTGPYRTVHAPAQGAWRDRLTERDEELSEQIAYWRGVYADLQAAGAATDYGPHNVAKGDLVKIRYGWVRVARVNAKTVSVETDYSWTQRYPWHEVRDHKAA